MESLLSVGLNMSKVMRLHYVASVSHQKRLRLVQTIYCCRYFDARPRAQMQKTNLNAG